MGEIIGLGLSHGPFIGYVEEDMANMCKRVLASPKTPMELKDPKNWPEPMRLEWGDDEALSSAYKHRAQLVEGVRKLRAELDAFNPDFVVIWGDDQYENFREDLVPAFCVYIEEEYQAKPWSKGSGLGTTTNVWGEPPETVMQIKGNTQGAKALAQGLLDRDFDIAYAFKQNHSDLSHAFWRTVNYLDYDRNGFPYPIIPFHVNCYGRGMIRMLSRIENGPRFEPGEFPPSAPSPRRCYQIGAATAQIFRDSPWRVALIGSSSWSHATLSANNHFVWPNVPEDKKRFAELKAGNYEAWSKLPLSQIEHAGQHEMLNWICLAGAMNELNLKPAFLDFAESWIFNSSKAVGIFK